MRIKKIKIAPSILSADFSQLSNEIRKVENAKVEMLHLDIMDGHFVPNITIGPAAVSSIRKITDLILDTHLMIAKPEEYIIPFAKAGSDIITVHFEAAKNLKNIIKKIKKFGVKVGISIKPKTSEKVIFPYLKNIDLVLVMTVEPGFGGQEFIADTLKKIEKIKKVIDKKNYRCEIEVDGGINPETAYLVAKAGANILVAGNYIFKSKNIPDTIKQIRKKAELGKRGCSVSV